MNTPKPGEPGFVPPGGIDCRTCTDMFLDYVEDALPAAQRRSFDEHHRFCVGCRTYLTNYRRVAQMAAAAADIEADGPTAVPENTIAAILRARRHDHG
jgi:predicted anti-sigma-YlaC factor YlaD